MIKHCTVENCVNDYYAKGYCSRHYQQIFKFGHVQERTKADLNEFVVEGDICRIFLYNNQSEKIAETIIDAEDYERCYPYKWYTLKDDGVDGYYVRNVKVGWLAPFILRFKSSNTEVVDHIDGHTLNNKKSNLQVCTYRENNIKRKMSTSISGYRGVVPSGDCWRVQIGSNGKKYHLGSFVSKEEAALAYNEKAKELFGKFAVFNNIPERESKILGFSTENGNFP